jgi:predicted kinase
LRYFIVSGLPGSGKTSLGRSLARAFDLPLLDKDEILEGLFDSLGGGDAEWRSRLSRAADEVLRRLALESGGAVLVSFWKHPQSTSASGTPTSWLNALPGPVVEVHCVCTPETAAQRFLARQRHAGHLDHLKRADEVLEASRNWKRWGTSESARWSGSIRRWLWMSRRSSAGSERAGMLDEEEPTARITSRL